ncbi:MAG: DUF2247 family protein [Ancrocorticia sp.]
MSSRFLENQLLPPEYTLARVVPTAQELVYGYQQRWVSDDGAVRLGEAQYALGMPQTPSVEEVALLLRDEYYNVERLMYAAAREIEAEGSPLEGEEPWRVWMFLAFSWALEHRSDYDDLMMILQILWADFGYPLEIRDLIRWVSQWPGEPPVIDSLLPQWQDYLSVKGAEYAERTARFAGDGWTPTNSG